MIPDLRRLNFVLLVLAIVLGGVLVLMQERASDGATDESEAQQTARSYADVRQAASAEVRAFLGIDHEQVDEQVQVVLDGATGDFQEQYAGQVDSITESARNQQSRARATVLEVGVIELDATRAIVLVAADTEVTSRSTGGKARTVPWRIRLEMVEEGGRWLTSGLRFVG